MLVALTAAVLLFAGSFAGSLAAQDAPPAPSGAMEIPPVAIADDGTGVTRVLAATRFTLETPYRSDWGVDRPNVQSGLIVVLEVRKDLVKPRQTRQSVLFAGTRVAEVTNVGFTSGRLVVIIADPAKGAAVDLAEVELFFGTAMLPERVTPTRGGEERAAARAKGIAPLPADARAVVAEGALALTDKDALYRAAGERILIHAPDEKDRADGYIAGSP